ncbi:MAG: hypothetical protein ACQ9MH_08335 [Nitrospinales bacterium]
MDEFIQPIKLIKTFTAALTNDSSKAIYKVYRKLYQLGESVIPEIEAQLLDYKWDNIEYKIQIKILSGLLSLVNDINEERAGALGEKIRNKGCNEVVDKIIKSILDFSLDDFKSYSINGVVIYQSKSLGYPAKIKNKLATWLSMVPNEDLKKIERLYLIPTHEKCSGSYMPFLCNIMVVWNISVNYNPLSYFRLLWIEHTLYHEIGHHVCRHTFGQDPEQEKEADRYAAEIFMKNHPIFNMIVKTLKFDFGNRKAHQEKK